MSYLWYKVLHIVFFASWFAGLFYLPRIYVNMARLQYDSEGYTLLLGMAKRLLRFMTVIAVVNLVFGLLLISKIGINHGWLHFKLLLVFFVFVYHYACYVIYKRFRSGTNKKEHTFYRWFNEIPVLLMLIIVYLVIFKPF
ncbi:MAG: CopD family protein [Alcaligenaceae bacterium]|nr:CopD family protein [Alcaligenaceae bacterium]